MSAIVSQVHSLAAAAAGVLPRADDVRSLTDVDEMSLLSELSALRRSVDAAISLLASDIDRKSARELGAESMARKAGVRSGAELVQRVTGSSLGDARKAVRVGALLETAQTVAPMDDTDARPGPRSIDTLAALAGAWDAPIAVAVRNGWLPSEHADRIQAALGQPRDQESAHRWREAVLRLIADCWDGDLTPEDAGRAAKTIRACLDRDWARENSARLYEQRSLKRTVRGDGMVKYDLLLDPVTDAEVWTPIHRALAPRLGGPRFMTDEERRRAEELEHDARTNEQLLCDTFTSFLTAGVTTSGVFGKYTPTVNITVTTRELTKAITTDTNRRNTAPTRTACHTADPRVPPPPPDDGIGWLDGKPEPLTGPRLVAALCNGRAAGILLDETGQTLDATKAERTHSLRQRRAMSIRDGGCLVPGCTMPAGACEAHHCNPWSQHPENHKTETRDGILLCKFHQQHREHKRKLTARRVAPSF